MKYAVFCLKTNNALITQGKWIISNYDNHQEQYLFSLSEGRHENKVNLLKSDETGQLLLSNQTDKSISHGLRNFFFFFPAFA